jgi:hypothetical protein
MMGCKHNQRRPVIALQEKEQSSGPFQEHLGADENIFTTNAKQDQSLQEAKWTGQLCRQCGGYPVI